MNLRSKTTASLSLALIMGLFLSSSLFAQQDPQETKDVIIIPQGVKDILKQGMSNQEPRPDIPFEFAEHLYLPAQQNFHNIFLFKVKNADLGFVPLQPAETAEEEQEETPPEEIPEKMAARRHAFLQFNRFENNTPGELVKEVYIPIEMEIDSTNYDPDEKALYSTGYPLAPGNYILSMAICTPQLEKIGTQYLTFELPDPASFTQTLDTTPIFFSKDIKRMSSPETTAEIHRGYFTYSVLQIVPNLNSEFSPGDNLDIFFYIFGAQPEEEGKFAIEIDYQVFQEEELIIRYAQQTYDFPIISQPLPMKKTVIIRTTKGEEVTEEREQQNLDPGEYTLSLEITDTISGKTLTKEINFTVI